MGCFIIPLTEAVATTALRRRAVKRQYAGVSLNPFAAHLRSLELMLWGGSLMLIVDHIINGEVTWMYPFFTALSQEGGGVTLLREMLTVGVPMSVLVTTVWLVYVLIQSKSSLPLSAIVQRPLHLLRFWRR